MDNLPEVVPRDEWLAARKALLAKEKAFTRERDALNADRRRLPMVRVEEDYAFTGPDGPLKLIALFEGRGQLVVYHFMWLYDKNTGCPSCSSFADQIGGLRPRHPPHNAFPLPPRAEPARNTSFACTSRAEYADIEAFKARMGWTFPWYSSLGSDFNFDYHVTFAESVAPFEYNFADRATLEAKGLPVGEWEQPFDLHGLSAFLRVGDDVFPTY